MGEIPRARKEPHERSPLVRDVVANRPAEHRISGLERVENRPLRDLTLNEELDLAIDLRESP